MRANVGVPPARLLDQHLIAEYRELLIPGGWQIKKNWNTIAPIPSSFRLGQGHITFWRDKHLYLARRHTALIAEMKRRGFKPSLEYWSLEAIPSLYKKDWTPALPDTKLVRDRIIERFLAKPTWYRYYGRPVDLSYVENLLQAELYDS